MHDMPSTNWEEAGIFILPWFAWIRDLVMVSFLFYSILCAPVFLLDGPVLPHIFHGIFLGTFYHGMYLITGWETITPGIHLKELGMAKDDWVHSSSRPRRGRMRRARSLLWEHIDTGRLQIALRMPMDNV